MFLQFTVTATYSDVPGFPGRRIIAASGAANLWGLASSPDRIRMRVTPLTDGLCFTLEGDLRSPGVGRNAVVAHMREPFSGPLGQAVKRGRLMSVRFSSAPFVFADAGGAENLALYAEVAGPAILAGNSVPVLSTYLGACTIIQSPGKNK